jgi:hypothetical protein
MLGYLGAVPWVDGISFELDCSEIVVVGQPCTGSIPV